MDGRRKKVNSFAKTLRIARSFRAAREKIDKKVTDLWRKECFSSSLLSGFGWSWQ